MEPSLRYLECVRKMPLMPLPVRTTVVTLSSAVVLFAPGSTLSDEALRCGAVTDVVAPNLYHTDGVIAAARIHPTARLWGPVGIREHRPELTWHGILGVDPWLHEAELGHVTLAGMPRMNESALVHRESRTLLIGDLLFNLRDAHGLGGRLVLGAFGTYRRLAMSRLLRMFVKDKAAFTASLRELLALDFDRLAPSHGALVEHDAKAQVRAALAERGFDV